MTDATVAGTWTIGDRVVHRMGFGSMRLTVNPDTTAAVQVLRRAVELGVDHIDTAAFYCSPGGIIDVGPEPVRHATALIRKAISPYGDKVFIATKVGPRLLPDGGWTFGDLRNHVEENLRRLGVDTLDLVNLRMNGRTAAVSDWFGELAEMRAEGLIRHLGLSNVSVAQLDEAARIAPVVCVQNAYAVDVRRDDELLRVCGERGIAFVPFFAIAGPGRESGPPPTSSAADPSPTGPARAGSSPAADVGVRLVAQRHGVSEHQVRLAWTLHQGPHVLAIPGTGDLAHLEQNIAAAALHLTADDLAAIDQSPG
ncbi:aldo/keto reductase [Actinoplanes sp. HUAS TT8]|uniref:aldo/keto reductase n=1 Tax=Actinoplanes sp. HUAS TT8 TaxID=3447453 RepID=UPI003F51D2C5